ncbi:DEAD/DEAH box helicase family protein [[Mycoplasma] cavipharyngis]|uniref:DEAD/DEAH box helicase family protein n=1 Tax=[Mycoplasma] cavipharyngis TaxID=92757 RepID=UPI003704B6C4
MLLTNQTHSFSNDRYLFATTNNISKNIDQNKFIFFGPEKISKLDIDWDQFQWKDFFKNQKINFLEKKKLRRDQEDAVKAVIDGFKTSDRGKLVMACGTGKTLTSLKIVEQLYHQHHQPNQAFNVLYLVPSIALLSQTIIEWRIQAEIDDLRTFAICSDVGSADIENIDQLSDQILNSLPIRATTDATKIAEQYHSHFRKVNIFFSTYQSINVIAELAKKHKLVFDIAVCDEAHRTIGGYLKHDEKENVNFMKIHKDRYVPAKKRLYMTATEKIYTERAKKQAKKEGYDVYSMDDTSQYGPLFYRLNFGQAIDLDLLTDYKVIVFEVTNNQVIDKGSLDIDFDTNAKVIAALNAISKISSKTYNFSYDPKKMKRVIAFCSRIDTAENIAATFNHFSKANYLNDDRIVIPVADVIRGRDPSKIKTEKINWLSKEVEPDHCHILTNARCLTEGIDVPLLDGVIFMNDIQSQVDIIQAVGRVMRKGDGKNMVMLLFLFLLMMFNQLKQK